MPLGGTLFDLTCGALLGLFRLALCALSLGLAWLSFCFLRRALGKVRGPFIDGLYSPDLALQMIGRDGDMTPIVRHSGHLPLLRNLALDSKVFIPLYIVAFFAAILLLAGAPFTVLAWSFNPLAGMAMLLTLLGAVLDWRENAKLGEGRSQTAWPSTYPREKLDQLHRRLRDGLDAVLPRLIERTR